MKHYFASDGNYGSAVDLSIIETSEWTAQDWQRIENASDSERDIVARQIDREHREKDQS